MKNIWLISQNTLKEMYRDRIIYGLFGFALIFMASLIFLGSISLGQDIKIIKDLGLAGIYLFAIVLTLFFGTKTLSKEIENKTHLLIVSRPVSNLKFIIGKFLGAWLGIAASLSFLEIIYLFIIFIKGGRLDWLSLWQLALLLFQMAMTLSMAMLFSARFSQLPAIVFSGVILYIGHSLDLLKKASNSAPIFIKSIVELIYYLFPNFERFNLRNTIVYAISPTFTEIITPVLYSIIFCVLIVWLINLSLKQSE